MKKNIIIAVETLIIVFLVVLLLGNKNNTGSKETTIEDPNKAVIGIYHNEQDKQTIRLEESNICMFIEENKECNYSVENDIIKIHTTYFIVEADNMEKLTLVKAYKTISECKEDLTKEKAYKDLINVRCKEQDIAKLDYEARIVNNGYGLLVNNKIFNKIA